MTAKKFHLKEDLPFQSGLVQRVNERTLVDYTANKTDFENSDQQVKSMMKHSDNANLKKVRQGYVRCVERREG